MREVDPKPFVEYCTRRQAATDARRAGRPQPWSEDPIIAGKKFCSVRRDDDRGSVQARSLILSLPEEIRQAAVLSYRLYNRPETLAHLASRGVFTMTSLSGKTAIREAIAELERAGEPVLSAAYKIQVAGGLKNLNTISDMIHRGIRAAARQEFELRPHSAMYTCHGIRGSVGSGAFVCYQTMQDLAWIQPEGFRYKDQDSWALIGIGAIRGLSRLLGVYGAEQKWENDGSLTDAEFRRAVNLLDRLTVLRKTSALDPVPEYALEIMQRLMLACREAGLGFFDMFEVEHNLCEYDKYERVRTGEAKGVTFTPRDIAGAASGDEGGGQASRRGGRPRKASEPAPVSPAVPSAPAPVIPDDADEFIA